VPERGKRIVVDLAERVRNMKEKALLTVNDVGPMREIFKGFSTSASRSSTRPAVTRPRSGGELIVMNWQP